MNSTYIRCLDEGHGSVNPMPHETERNTALMVNPAASVSVLLDAANARAARIVDVTNVFIEIETEDIDFSREDACRLLTTVGAMAHEVCRLLVAAEIAQGRDTKAIRLSYRQTVEAAEALIEAVNINDLKKLPSDKQKAITDAVFDMEGNTGAARDDFLGARKE